MAIISKAEAETLLEPYMQDLCAPIFAAWERWENLAPADRQPLTPRTRANWLFDWTVAHAKARLDRPPVMTLTEQPGFLVVTIEDRIAVRYKKLTGLGICGIGTEQFKLWRSQSPLDGMEELTHLVVGYQVSEYGQLENVKLVCSRGGRGAWYLDAPKESADIVAFPTPAESPAPKITPVRRRADVADGDLR